MPSLFNSRRAFSRSVSSAFISPGLFFGGFNRFLPRLCLEGCIFGAVEHRKRLFSQPMTLGEGIGESFQHIRDYSNRADGHLYLQIMVAGRRLIGSSQVFLSLISGFDELIRAGLQHWSRLRLRGRGLRRLQFLVECGLQQPSDGLRSRTEPIFVPELLNLFSEIIRQ